MNQQLHSLVEQRRILYQQTQKAQRQALLMLSRAQLQKLSFFDQVQKQGSTPHRIKQSIRIAQLIQTPQWLTGPLKRQDFVFALKPLGKRCLLFTNGKCTRAIDKQGNMLMNFRSSLPAGGLSGGNPDLSCCLQGFLDKQKRELRVYDLLEWMGMSFCSKQFEERYKCLNNFLRGMLPVSQSIKLQILQFSLIDFSKLIDLYNSPLPKDGFIFYHKATLYQSGSTPNVLFWKDHHTSRFALDGSLFEPLHATLKAADNSSLLTCDSALVQFQGSLEIELQRQKNYKVEVHKLQTDQTGSKFKADIKILKPSQHLRPDCLSRILFQLEMRKGTIGLDRLLSWLIN